MLTLASIIEVAKKDAIEALATLRPFAEGLVSTADFDDVDILLVGNDATEVEGGHKLAEMNELMEGYEVLIYASALEYYETSWGDDQLWASPKEFQFISSNEGRIVAKLVETVYHELRHVFSAVLASARGQDCWRTIYAIESMKMGYWGNKYERVAYKFQQSCWSTVQKFIDENGELKEEVEW